MNLKHLEARLKQTKSIESDTILTKEILIELLEKRFSQIDFDIAKSDVRPFIKDQDNLDIWNSDFFKSITQGIKID